MTRIYSALFPGRRAVAAKVDPAGRVSAHAKLWCKMESIISYCLNFCPNLR